MDEIEIKLYIFYVFNFIILNWFCFCFGFVICFIDNWGFFGYIFYLINLKVFYFIFLKIDLFVKYL